MRFLVLSSAFLFNKEMTRIQFTIDDFMLSMLYTSKYLQFNLIFMDFIFQIKNYFGPFAKRKTKKKKKITIVIILQEVSNLFVCSSVCLSVFGMKTLHCQNVYKNLQII